MSPNVFRILVVASVLLSVLSGLFDFLWADDVTLQIKEFASEVEPLWSDYKSSLVFGVATLSTIILVISFIGLLIFWSPARYLYLANFLLTIPFIPFLGTAVMSGPEKTLQDIANISSGLIVALIFFSPIKERFVRRKGVTSPA